MIISHADFLFFAEIFKFFIDELQIIVCDEDSQ